MSMTAFDLYLQQQKSASDALIQGQVGMGVTPGVTGMLDSDPAGASYSAQAAQRAQMQEAILLANPNADGGVGYSNPAPGTSPALQMQADVKTAAVIDEAVKFAEYIYTMNKQALSDEQRAYAKEQMAKNLASNEGVSRATPENRGRAPMYGAAQQAKAQIAADFTDMYNSGAVAPTGRGQIPYTAQPSILDRAKATAGHAVAAMRAHPVRTGLGAAAGAAAVGGGAYLASQQGEEKAANFTLGGWHVGRVAPTAGQRLDRGIQHAQNLAQSPGAQAAALALGAAGVGAAGAAAYGASKEASVMDAARDWFAKEAGFFGDAAGNVRNVAGGARDKAVALYGGARGHVEANPTAYAGAAGVAGGAGGVQAAHFAAHQMQLAQMQAAHEQGLARPENPTLSGIKAASLEDAAELGRYFALQQMGLVQ